VGDDDDRRTQCGGCAEQLDHGGAGVDVELAGRLVGEQQARSVRERGRYREPLLLTTGEQPRGPRGDIGEPDRRQQLGGPPALAGTGPAAGALGEEQVLGGARVAEQVGPGVLQHDAHLTRPHVRELPLGEPREVASVQADPSGGGSKQTREQREQGRLPRARRAQEGQ